MSTFDPQIQPPEPSVTFPRAEIPEVYKSFRLASGDARCKTPHCLHLRSEHDSDGCKRRADREQPCLCREWWDGV